MSTQERADYCTAKQRFHTLIVTSILILLCLTCMTDLYSSKNLLFQQPAKAQCLNQRNDAESLLSSFENSTIGVKMKYPSKWEKVKNSSSDNVVIFRVRDGNISDKFRPGVGLYVHDLPYRNISLTEYSGLQIDSLKKSFNITESKMTKLGGLPAPLVVYKEISKGISGLQVWTIRNDRIYMIIYLADLKDFSNYLPYTHGIINSFEFNTRGGFDPSFESRSLCLNSDR